MALFKKKPARKESVCLGSRRLLFCVCVAERASVSDTWYLARSGTACWRINCCFTSIKTKVHEALAFPLLGD